MTDENLEGSVEVSLTPLQRFEEFLQSRGKRNTEQRRILVEHVFSKHEHFDADELNEDLAKAFGQRRVSRATVYRTLDELVEAGLLRKMEIGGRAVYEHDYGYPQHDHLHCEKCDKLIEFQSDKFQEFRDQVASEHGFRVTGHRLIINGICKDCSQSKRRPKRLLDQI